MVSFEEIKNYFDAKFRALEENSTTVLAEMEKNSKKRDENLIKQINGFTVALKKLARRQDLLAEENENLRFELQRLRNEFNYEQGRDRAANLIIRNCATKDDLEEIPGDSVLEIFKNSKVNIECEDIISAKREGMRQIEGKVRPIKIRLADPKLKKLIFPMAKNIRTIQGITIDNDYTPPQREELF